MNGEPVVVAAGLRKRYGDLAAVDDISFKVRRGEIFGMVGPNGAGKTTTGGVPRRAAAARRRAGAAAGARSATRNG